MHLTVDEINKYFKKDEEVPTILILVNNGKMLNDEIKSLLALSDCGYRHVIQSEGNFSCMMCTHDIEINEKDEDIIRSAFFGDIVELDENRKVLVYHHELGDKLNENLIWGESLWKRS